jgi:hypothetical protein
MSIGLINFFQRLMASEKGCAEIRLYDWISAHCYYNLDLYSSAITTLYSFSSSSILSRKE